MKGQGMARTNEVDAMAHLAAEMTEAVVLGQAKGLRLLLAEMQALTQVLPGRAQSDVAHQTSDAEIEADGFQFVDGCLVC